MDPMGQPDTVASNNNHINKVEKLPEHEEKGEANTSPEALMNQDPMVKANMSTKDL